MWSDDLLRDAAGVLDAFRQRGWRIATAESCTGGLVAAILTEIPGSSDAVDRGFVTYSNDAKIENLGVPSDLLVRHGAVSEPVARAMAEGAIRKSRADVAIAITGVAGPGGGSAEKPVGLVHLACASRGGPTIHRECRFGALGRGPVRLATVREALAMLNAAAA